MYNQNQYENYEPAVEPVVKENTYSFSIVFLWMFAGILITGLVAYLISLSPAAVMVTYSWPCLIVSSIVQIVLAIYLGNAALRKLNKKAAIACFFLYAALNGLTFGLLFYVVSAPALFAIFGISAGYFGLMALFSVVFKNSLRKSGRFLMIGLISLLIMSIVSIFFWYNNGLMLGISILGLLVFGGLTAYDLRWIRDTMSRSDNPASVAIYGAFHLYLDFINIFIYILRIFLLNSRKN